MNSDTTRPRMRPRMLFLCQTLPYPPDGGVTIRTFNILRLLSRRFEITALCFYRKTDRPTDELVAESVARLRPFAQVEAFAIPQERSLWRYLVDHARSLVSRRAYTLHAYESLPFRRRVDALLSTERFDIVHVDSLDLAGYLHLFREIPLVCVHHNVESELLRRRAEGTGNPLAHWYLSRQAAWIERLERHWCPRVTMNVAVSEIDASKFRELAPAAHVLVIPNGVDVENFRPDRGPQDGIVFVGGANWFPNRDALEFFATDILPAVRQRLGEVRVLWVGRAEEELQSRFLREHGIVLTGYVEDVRPYINNAACYVVPIRVGGGTRLKILDAWALGKPVVSTSAGCEGLAAVDGQNIMIRDEPAAFAEAVAAIVRDTELARRLARAARATAEETYSWEVIGHGMLAQYERLLDVKATNAKDRLTAPMARGR